jgi:death on curing protein
VVRYLDTGILLSYLTREGFHAKDVGLLDAALKRPGAAVFGTDAYPSLELKAAAQTQSIIKNHPMVDGNKRAAWFALNALLALNYHLLEASQDDAFEFLIGLATDALTLEEAADWIRNRLVPL